LVALWKHTGRNDLHSCLVVEKRTIRLQSKWTEWHGQIKQKKAMPHLLRQV
jgi:hypothetical protein